MRNQNIDRDDESGQFAKASDPTVGHEKRLVLNADEKNILELVSLMMDTGDEDSLNEYFGSLVVRLVELRGNKLRELTEKHT